MQDKANTITRILIVDDHPVVVSGCRSLFASDPSVEIDGAADAKAGQRAFLRNRPDVTIVDIRLPDASGFELIGRIRTEDPAAKIILLTMSEDPAQLVCALEMGVQGYVSKSDDPLLLIKAIRIVAAGERFLSPRLEAISPDTAAVKASPAVNLNSRELDVLRLLGQGRKIAEVASRLDISYKTAANTTSALKEKLGAKNHADLVRLAVEIDLR